MRGRFLLLAAPIVAPIIAACGCSHDGYYGYSQNEILFGIRQKTDTASGKKDVSAGYEFLGLAHKGGWSASVFRDGDGDGTCYFERYDNRLGQPRVESGVATFSGAKLPPAGLQILANQTEPSKATDGWATNDTLMFSASGFAMPSIRSSYSMNAPATELTIGAITPTVASVKKEVPSAPAAPAAPADAGAPAPIADAGGADGAASTADAGAPPPPPETPPPPAAPPTTTITVEEMTLKPTDDVSVAWTAAADEKVPTRVMISLETDESVPGGPDVPGGNVRCFNRASAGSAVIPKSWVARLFSSVDPAKPIKGRLEISTHRQLTIHARGSWTVYVVATSQHRDIAFSGTR